MRAWIKMWVWPIGAGAWPELAPDGVIKVVVGFQMSADLIHFSGTLPRLSAQLLN